MLISGPAGHVLQLPAQTVDAHVFADRVRHGESAWRLARCRRRRPCCTRDSASGVATSSRTGRPNGYASAEVDLLRDLRSSALEGLGDARLRLGDHAGVIGDLQQLLAEHPYRERPAGLLMLALYRAGRSADALAIYQRLRDELAEGLGADPAPSCSSCTRRSCARTRPWKSRRRNRSARPPSCRRGSATSPGVQTSSPAWTSSSRSGRSRCDHKIVLISGVAGMGKTALAVEWAHHAARTVPRRPALRGSAGARSTNGTDARPPWSAACCAGSACRPTGSPTS